MASNKKPSNSRGTSVKWAILAVVALVALSVLAYRRSHQVPGSRSDALAAQSQNRTAASPPYYGDPRGITFPKTMPPDRFAVSKTRDAYHVAAEIPETLAQMPCYCSCDRIGHKSLLDCYADEHAAYCDICQDSALWSEKRVKQSASIATIRQEIASRYAVMR